MEQWEAARFVIHELLLRTATETTRLATGPVQDIGPSEGPSQSSTGLDLENFDLVNFLQGSNAVSNPIAELDDLFAGFSVPEIPMAAIHDLGPRIVQLEQELAAAHAGRAQAEATMRAVRHSLSRACNELAETSTLSAMARRMLQGDAPDVLYSIDRALSMRAAHTVAPGLTNDNPGSSEGNSSDGSKTQDVASWLDTSSQFQHPAQVGAHVGPSGYPDPTMLFPHGLAKQQTKSKGPRADNAHDSTFRFHDD